MTFFLSQALPHTLSTGKKNKKRRKNTHTSYFPDTLYGTLDNDHTVTMIIIQKLFFLPSRVHVFIEKKTLHCEKICYAERKRKRGDDDQDSNEK